MNLYYKKHGGWIKVFKPLFKGNIRYVEAGAAFDTILIRNCEVVWIQNNATPILTSSCLYSYSLYIRDQSLYVDFLAALAVYDIVNSVIFRLDVYLQRLSCVLFLQALNSLYNFIKIKLAAGNL